MARDLDLAQLRREAEAIGEPPCDCVGPHTALDGSTYFWPRCDCMNTGEATDAATWCVERKQKATTLRLITRLERAEAALREIARPCVAGRYPVQVHDLQDIARAALPEEPADAES